ncbi:hypothetical protein HLB44_23775 [Aquincola sp. S2]|uniref:Uncharacterized protein n=1 Tax=Pseudaquabacterium terrae TaxID=2732868 RepID=A0ABX2EN32_9BURK|nr:hypothetical protein [Aquabacterium terrae]NRF70028.1 hypothetical protein [Aquabacterium terrae]
MDRRNFSRLAASACAAPLATLVGCGGGADTTADTGPQRQALGSTTGTGRPTVVKWHATPNPTGLRIGFWETFGRRDVTLASMGRRPSARVGFDNWSAIETAPGVYDWRDNEHAADTHRYGESVLTAVNISFAIPRFYQDDASGNVDIENPATRAAALKFLRAYVRRLLKRHGALALTIDYEIVSNFKLYRPDPQRDHRARAWGRWYVEAAAAARDEAAQLGLPPGQLTLQPIVNGDPLDPANPMSGGAAMNPWLVDVMAVSDVLALDTYHRDASRPVDPTYTLRIIDYWRREFAAGKPVVVAEHGFSSIVSDGGDDAHLGDPDKFHGTRADQLAYYDRLFTMLLEANQPAGMLRNQLRGLHLWSITDNLVSDKPHSRYYGLHEKDGAPKPAAAAIQRAIRLIEGDQLNDGDPLHRPYHRSQSDPANLADSLRLGTQPVNLVFTEGDHFEFLRYRDQGAPAHARSARLKVALAQPGSLLVCVNGHWLHEPKADPVHLSAHYKFGAADGGNVIDVHATAEVFPARHQVLSLRIAYD